MTLTTRTLTRHIGTEITGIDLRDEIDPQTVAELKSLLDSRHLLFFPGQGLSPEEQIAFMELFGTVTSDGAGESLHGYISNRRLDSGVHADAALLWHSDNGWSPAPTHFIALGGEKVVGRLAPTLFASAVRAAEELPQALRERIAGLQTINMANLAPADEGDVTRSRVPVPELRRVWDAVPADDYYYPRWTYPMLWRHPRTGVELLPVYEDFSVCIEGMTPADSEDIYQSVFRVLYDTDHVYDHHWQQDDLVIWDNIALQHGRPAFHGAHGERTLVRTTINPAKDVYLQHARRLADYSRILRQEAAQ